MLLTINPDLSLLVEQPLSRLPLAAVKLPRGSKVPIWVQFARDAAVIDPSEALTSGTLVVGLYYKITTFVAGDSFTNVGAASNATSVYFLCTGTTPTTWTNSSTLQQCDSAGVLFSLIFSVKKHQEYDGAVLVLASGTDFTKFGTGTSTIFKSKCSFSTAEINTLLGVDASVANDESEVTLMGEVSWLGPDESKAFPFQIDLQNDSYKVNDVVTSTPGVQAMSLVTTSSEALLPGSRVLTAGSNIAITTASGIVTIASTSGGTVTSVAQSFTGGIISVAGSPITASGTLALTVAGTSGGIPYFSSGTTWATSAALAANALVVGGGAGQPPATVTTGANVLAALGVAVGSAGAFLTSAVTSITGTANEITVTDTTTPTLSLPSALTFTGKTVTDGTFTGGTFVLPQVGYLAATFDYFGEWMTFISSTDAATWKRTHTTPIVTTEGTIRDPALHYVAATGTFYVAYTRNAFTGGNSWGLGSSTDGRTWTWSTISTGSLATGTPAHVWIGDWFTDSDGTDHVLFAANTTASQAAGGLYLYETHPTTPGDYSAWSTPVQITGSAITNNLGNSPAVVKVGSTYHLFYDLPSAGGIRHVTSTSLTSGFNTAGTYPSFPSATEGPAIITLANGTYRLYAEQNYQQSTAGLKYSDSTDLVTWGSVQSAVTQGYMGHPHGIQVTSQELLNKVSMLEQGQKNPVWSSLYDGKTAVAIGYPDINTESAFGPYGEGLTIFGGASGGSFLYVSTRNQNGAAIFTDPNASSPAGNNFYIARRSQLNYMRFDGGSNNVSFYGTATFLGSTSGSATISVSATGGLLALPSGTTATNMTLTTPDLGTPSAIVLTNATGSPTGISLTMAQLNSIVSDGDPAYVGAANTFTTGQTISSTTSLLLGTAGSAVGTIGFNNATSGTTTLEPATGALGTGTVTLPLTGTLATLDGSETLANKRITQRTGTATSSATPTINTDNVDFYSLTAQAADITSFTTNLSGTPTEGQTLWIAITGTAARAITWGAKFEAGAVALPTTTVTTTRLDVAFVWNTVSLKWRCMASG